MKKSLRGKIKMKGRNKDAQRRAMFAKINWKKINANKWGIKNKSDDSIYNYKWTLKVMPIKQGGYTIFKVKNDEGPAKQLRKNISTRKEAMNYAQKYMEKHPKG
jgi:hypothetical protein